MLYMVLFLNQIKVPTKRLEKYKTYIVNIPFYVKRDSMVMNVAIMLSISIEERMPRPRGAPRSTPHPQIRGPPQVPGVLRPRPSGGYPAQAPRRVLRPRPSGGCFKFIEKKTVLSKL